MVVPTTQTKAMNAVNALAEVIDCEGVTVEEKEKLRMALLTVWEIHDRAPEGEK